MSDSETILARDISRDQLLAELRALRPQLEREGVAHMALFGSRARGDHRPDSDVDLMIEVMDGIKFSLLDLAGIHHIVEDHIRVAANVHMQRSMRADIRARLDRDKVDIF
jgi:predicted nucleotidyltransferase